MDIEININVNTTYMYIVKILKLWEVGRRGRDKRKEGPLRKFKYYLNLYIVIVHVTTLGDR